LSASGGDCGRAQLLAIYEEMHQAPFVPHRDVAAFVRDRGLRPWTTDPRLAVLARELGAYG
jgi:hypothetical protein